MGTLKGTLQSSTDFNLVTSFAKICPLIANTENMSIIKQINKQQCVKMQKKRRVNDLLKMQEECSLFGYLA